MKIRPTLRAAAAAVSAAALCLTAAACSSSDDEQARATADATLAESCVRPAERTTVSLGVGASLAYAYVFVADHLGYFDAENIDVDFTKVSNPADTLPLIGSGQIDAAFGGLSAGFLNAIDRDMDIRLAAARGEYPAEIDKAAGFYVRSDLIEDGSVKEISDLKGRTIGLAGGEGDIGNSGGFFLSRILGDGGLGLEDVSFANVTAADTQAAFTNKAIDAAFVPSPFSTNLVDSGIGTIFGNQELIAGETSGGLIIGPNLGVDDRTTGVAFIRALMRAAEVMQQQDYRENPDVIAALVEHGFKEDTITRTPLYEYHSDLGLNPETFETFQNTFRDMPGILTSSENVSFEELTDEGLRKAAASSLGTCSY